MSHAVDLPPGDVHERKQWCRDHLHGDWLLAAVWAEDMKPLDEYLHTVMTRHTNSVDEVWRNVSNCQQIWLCAEADDAVFLRLRFGGL